MYLNGMTGDTNGGVCLIKAYSYYTYEQTGISCPSGCTDETGFTTTNLPMHIYITPYINNNPYYSVDFTDQSICLKVDDISAFTESYINDLVTTGYTSYDKSGFEKRYIYDTTLCQYVHFHHDISSSTCASITDQKWAIIDYDTEDIYSGVGDYWYSQLNDCGDLSGSKYVYLRDINPDSTTYGQTQVILKCN